MSNMNQEKTYFETSTSARGQLRIHESCEEKHKAEFRYRLTKKVIVFLQNILQSGELNNSPTQHIVAFLKDIEMVRFRNLRREYQNALIDYRIVWNQEAYK